MEFFLKFKRELAYSVFVFVILEYLSIISTQVSVNLYILLSMLGGSLVLTWVVSSYLRFANRQVSEMSNVVVSLKVRGRIFQYFFLPVLFYSLTALYIYFNYVYAFQQTVIVLFSAVFYVLLVHIRSSYIHYFTISGHTKFVFDAVAIVLFYITTGVLLFFWPMPETLWIAIAVATAFILGFSALMHDEQSPGVVLFILVSSWIVGGFAKLFEHSNSFVYSMSLTVFFYMIISIWNLRVSGHRKLDAFITPILFTLMALMIILS